MITRMTKSKRTRMVTLMGSPRTTQLRKVDKSPPCLCTGKASTGRTSFLQSKTFVISLNTFLRITHLYLCIINIIYSNICPKRYFDYLTSENLYWALIFIKMCYNNKIVQKENVVSSPSVCIQSILIVYSVDELYTRRAPFLP